jgi:hypothetical protein
MSFASRVGQPTYERSGDGAIGVLNRQAGFMPLTITDQPAEPHCGGVQWVVADLDGLAGLVAVVLQGRAADAADALAGATTLDLPSDAEMKAQIRAELFPAGDPWHRDGLLFEIICWIVALQKAAPGEVVLEPHTKATQQGLDGLKVAWDEPNRRLTAATIYEYKCTTNARPMFRDKVIKAFKGYYDGKRDSQLIQGAIALLTRFNLNAQERAAAYSTIVYGRPFLFDAALTVEPDVFDVHACIDLFSRYDGLGARPQRSGSTMPLADVRAWFEAFAVLIWAKIDV